MRSVIVFNSLHRVHIDFLHIAHLFMKEALLDLHVFTLINADEIYLVFGWSRVSAFG